MAILIDKNVPFEPYSIMKNHYARYMIIKGKLFGAQVVLANVYARKNDDVAFFDRFFSLLPDLGTHSLILGLTLNVG